MKKWLCVLLAVCFVFLLAACARRPPRTDTAGGNEQTEEKEGTEEDIPSFAGEPLELSARMFDDASIEFGGADKIGIVVDEDAEPVLTGTTEGRSYIVSFNDDGTFEKITFVFTKTDEYSDGTYEVTQEQIEANPIKLHVTDAFVFLAYSMLLPDEYERGDLGYNLSYRSSDENFVIDRATEKLYSLEEFGRFEVASDSVIKCDSYPSDNYYALSVEDGVLQATDLLPNKNIETISVAEDKFGNYYVQTDSYEGRAGNVVYGKNLFYTGDDGYVYETTEDITMAYSLGNSYLLRRYGSDGEAEQNWNADTILRIYNDWDLSRIDFYIMLTGDEIYVFRPESGSLYYFWYGEKTETDTFVSLAYLWYMDGAVPVAPGMIAAYATYGTGGADQIWYYDMSEMYVDDRVESANQGYICDRGILYTEGDKAFVRTEEAQGTTVFVLEAAAGVGEKPSVQAKLYKEIDYRAEVITIQPLN